MERRREIRVPMQAPVEYHDPAGKVCHCVAENLSANGASLRFADTVACDRDGCHLRLRLPGCESLQEIAGGIRWHSTLPSGAVLGVEFSEPFRFAIPFSTVNSALLESIRQAEEEKNRLEQMLSVLSRAASAFALLLTPELRIVDVRGPGSIPETEQLRANLIGKPMGHLGALLDARVNGRADGMRLGEALESCLNTGESFSSDHCFLEGPNDESAELLRAGNFHTTISPMRNSEDRLAGLLLVLKPDDPMGIYSGIQPGKQNPFGQLLGAAASGLFVKNVLRTFSNPLTCLLWRLDLLRYKMELENGHHAKASGRGSTNGYTGEFRKIEELVAELSGRFKCMLDNAALLDTFELNAININETLANAIRIADIYEPYVGEKKAIAFERQASLPAVQANEQEFVMMFLVFLLLSKDSVRNIASKGIRCETRREGAAATVNILHNGAITQKKYLDIIFHTNPIRGCLAQNDTIGFMDTLLCYANLLLKKNAVKIRVNNIPGQFKLSLVIPAGHRRRART